MKVSRFSCQHRFHVLSRVCGRLEWNTWRWRDAVCSRSTSDLLPYYFGELVIQPHFVFFAPPLFSPVFTFLCGQVFTCSPECQPKLTPLLVPFYFFIVLEMTCLRTVPLNTDVIKFAFHFCPSVPLPCGKVSLVNKTCMQFHRKTAVPHSAEQLITPETTEITVFDVIWPPFLSLCFLLPLDINTLIPGFGAL